jgi:hypothetical protein
MGFSVAGEIVVMELAVSVDELPVDEQPVRGAQIENARRFGSGGKVEEAHGLS